MKTLIAIVVVMLAGCSIPDEMNACSRLCYPRLVRSFQTGNGATMCICDETLRPPREVEK